MLLKLKDTHFLFQSFISGIIEVGFVYYLWQLGYGLNTILIFALLYQIANFFSSIFFLNKKILYCLMIICATNIVYFVFYAFNIYCLGIIFFILSFFLQLLRGESKSNVSIFIKRTFRILGFINFYLFSINFILLISIYLFAMIFINKPTNVRQILGLNYNNLLSPTIMISHQAHYFLYCYIVMFILLQQVNNILLYGIIFSLGLVTYLLSKSMFGKLNMYYNVMLGHLILGINILLLFITLQFNFSFYLVVILWILTGFSAGTVFAIKNILIKNHYNISSIHFYENIGHVFGVILSIAIINSTTNIYNTIVISALFATLTALLTYTLYRKKYVRN